MTLKSAMNIKFDEIIFTSLGSATIQVVNNIDDAKLVNQFSSIWVKSGAILDRAPSLLLPNEDSQFFYLEETTTKKWLGCFGLRRFESYVEILNFCILPSHANQSIGSYIIHILTSRLMKGFILCAFSTKSIDWFLKAGFKEVDRQIFPASRLAMIPEERPTRAVISRRPPSKGHSVSINSSGKRILYENDKDQTLLDAVIRNNIDLDYLCESGICGTCQNQVLTGVVRETSPGSIPLGSSEILLCTVKPITNMELA